MTTQIKVGERTYDFEICSQRCENGRQGLCEVLGPVTRNGHPLDIEKTRLDLRYYQICIHYACRVGIMAANLTYTKALREGRDTGLEAFGTDEKPSGRFVDLSTGLIWSQASDGQLHKTGQSVSHIF